VNKILDKDGNMISWSANLRGIRRYVTSHAIQILGISRLSNGEGKLMILFEDKSNFETNFADFTVLANFVRNWRNVYGAPLLIDANTCGKVSKDNPDLLKIS